MVMRYSRRFALETMKLTGGSHSSVKEKGGETADNWGHVVSEREREKGGVHSG
jgi:hypothetical protein